MQEGHCEKLESRHEICISAVCIVVDGPGSSDATLSLCPFMARRRVSYASRSLLNYVGGCSVFDQANYSGWWRVQVNGMMELEWKRSDVLPEFRSAKTLRLLNILSMQLPINLLHESASFSALSVPYIT